MIINLKKYCNVSLRHVQPNATTTTAKDPLTAHAASRLRRFRTAHEFKCSESQKPMPWPESSFLVAEAFKLGQLCVACETARFGTLREVRKWCLLDENFKVWVGFASRLIFPVQGKLSSAEAHVLCWRFFIDP